MCRGTYRCFCVELQPQFLLLDAVLQADDLAEAEGGLALAAHGARSLAALRSLLLAWASDASCRCPRPIQLHCSLTILCSTLQPNPRKVEGETPKAKDIHTVLYSTVSRNVVGDGSLACEVCSTIPDTWQ